MGYTRWERFKRWLCDRFGHWPKMNEHGDEWCACCNNLLSTEYSRSWNRDI